MVKNKQSIEHSGKKENSKKIVNRTVTIIVIILLLLVTGLFAWQHFGGSKTNQLEASISAQLGQLEGKSEAEIQAELDRVVAEGTMEISINVHPAFRDGTSAGSLEIENSPSNHYAQVVSITLDDTGEEIYNSGLIMPNYHIQTDKLSVDLDAGDYDCTATFTAFDVTDQKSPMEIGAATAQITISVLG